MNKNRKRYSKKTGIRAMALSIAAAMAVTLYPIPAFAVEKRTRQQSRQRYRIKPEETFMIMENREMIRRHRMWMNLQL